MSTSDTSTFDSNVCPCGRGTILKHVTTQDNPWSSADIAYELSCGFCNPHWILETTGVALVSRVEAAQENAAREAWLQGGEPLHRLAEGLVSGYFADFGAKTKKAEWQEMQRLGIYAGSYRNYLQDKAKKRDPGKIAYGLRNQAWLEELARGESVDAELASLAATWAARRSEWEATARQVKRWPVERPRG